MKKIVVLLICLFSFVLLFAQDGEETDNPKVNHQLWIDLYPHFRINDKLEYYGDAGFRIILVERHWSKFYVRPSVRYKFKPKWVVHGGIGFFYLYDNTDYNQIEIRPWQGIQFNQIKNPKFSLSHFIRIEERVSFLPDDDWSSSFDLRFRYKLSTKFNLFRSERTTGWYVPLYVEIFAPLNKDFKEAFSDRNRMGTGLGHKFSNDLDISFVWHRHSTRVGAENKFNVTDYVYQLKIVRTWKKREK